MLSIARLAAGLAFAVSCSNRVAPADASDVGMTDVVANDMPSGDSQDVGSADVCPPLPLYESAFGTNGGILTALQYAGPSDALDRHGTLVGASFFYSFADGSAPIFSRVDGCELRRSGEGASFAPAGNLTITGLAATLRGQGTYGVSNDSLIWTAGTTVGVYSTGSVVPPFDASVVFPPIVQLVPPPIPLPAPADGGVDDAWVPMPISGGSDLVVRWVPLNSCGYVMVLLASDLGSGQLGVQARCAFPINAGSGTISAAVLAQLTGFAASYIGISTMAATQVTAGSWTIQLIAENGLYTHAITLQ